MDLLTSLKISSSALNANQKRMSTIASNIANSQTTRTAEGGPYRRKDVIFGAGATNERFSEVLEGIENEYGNSVHAIEILSTDRAPILKYDPQHPDSNSQGYVAYPNINTTEEMANMIQATRAYESNISAMNATKRMAKKSLEIGR